MSSTLEMKEEMPEENKNDTIVLSLDGFMNKAEITI